MTRLSVNVNKLATLRNARGKNTPNVADLARKILKYGAHGITVHPRPDGRHIRTADVWELQKVVLQAAPSKLGAVEYNLEGYPSDDFVELVQHLKPDQVTLVPDPPEALTSNAGWDLVQHFARLQDCLKKLKSAKIRVSLFVDPLRVDLAQRDALFSLRPDRIELYTERFADDFHSPQKEETTRRFKSVAELAFSQGILVNAGHDLNQENLRYLIKQIPQIAEVSIGHALICEALEQGLEQTIGRYLNILSSP